MIKYSLHCEDGHQFEGWFRSADDFDRQANLKVLSCPTCSSTSIEKALMAPSVSTSKKKDLTSAVAQQEQQKMMAVAMRELRDKATKDADYVGDKFADEARKIHYGETKERGIYGEATVDEAKQLVDEGVNFMPLPNLPEDHN